MTYDETLAIMGVLKAAYPNYYRDMKRSEAEGIVTLWAEMFADYSAAEVALAVKAHIANDKKGYPPHIGAITESIQKLRHQDDMTELEAWGMVMKAIRNGIYNSREEYEALPPILQKLVGGPDQLREWAIMDTETINSVVASNFQRSFKARAKNEREYMALPSDVRQKMEALAAGMEMPRLESENTR